MRKPDDLVASGLAALTIACAGAIETPKPGEAGAAAPLLNLHEPGALSTADYELTGDSRATAPIPGREPSPAVDLVIEDTSIFDVRTGRLLPNRTVIVDESRIAAVLESGSALPVSARTLDGRGRVLVPGLIDVHSHLAYILGDSASAGGGMIRGEAASEPTDGETVRGLSRILVQRGDRRILVNVRDVDWLEAAGDYVRVHAGERTYLTRDTMARLEEELGDPFVRVHRSAIVRTDAIREMRPKGHGDHDVVLGDGTKLRLSRTYRDRLASALGVEL